MWRIRAIELQAFKIGNQKAEIGYGEPGTEQPHLIIESQLAGLDEKQTENLLEGRFVGEGQSKRQI